VKLLLLLNSCIATNWVYVNINGSQLQTSAYSLSIWCSCIWEKQNWIPYKCWNVDEGEHHQLFLFVCAPHHYIIIQFNWLAIMILLSSLTLFFILFNLNAIPYSLLILFRIYVNFSKAISHSFNFFLFENVFKFHVNQAFENPWSFKWIFNGENNHSNDISVRQLILYWYKEITKNKTKLNKKWKWLTEGTLSLVQAPSDRSLSLISQANIEGHSRLYWAIFPTTSDVATRGLLPPIARGRIEPVS
jgi:hypothetical protein